MARHLLPNYRIAIVGAGAIGCYYGGKLAQFGRDVHFLFRSDYDTVRKRGLRIRSRTENILIPKVNAYRSTGAIGECDLVIVAVKTTANSQLPELLQPLVGDKTMILTLQNGLGNEQFLASSFDPGQVLGGICYVCLNRTAPGTISSYHGDRLILGEFSGYPLGRTHDIAWEFKRSGVVATVTAELMRERWRKLVWNIPFNGLTITGGGIDTATLLANDHLRQLALTLMDEVIAIANAAGYPLSTSLSLEQIKRTEKMGAYKPSSVIDYLAGLPLEIEPIWGEPLRRAKTLGVVTPVLEELYAKLVALEKKREK